MGKTIAEVITEFQVKIMDFDSQSLALKRKVNELAVLDGQAEPYPELPQDIANPIKSKTVRLRPDEFTADKMMKAMRRYLEMRKEVNPDNAPTKPEEIADALRDGGYDFKGKDPLTAVSISLGKSSHTFKRLNSGAYGLQLWYGGRPRLKVTAPTDTDEEGESEPETDTIFSNAPAEDNGKEGDE